MSEQPTLSFYAHYSHYHSSIGMPTDSGKFVTNVDAIPPDSYSQVIV